MTGARFVTIGHSTHDTSTFLQLLIQHNVTAVADVRSVPSSRYNPQFNRHTLRQSLEGARIKYVFLGGELGARSDDPTCYQDGRVQYDRLAGTAPFKHGIGRLFDGAQSQRIAVMCSEAEPLDCHRTVLVARVLEEHGAAIDHIHRDGRIESHQAAMCRLMSRFHLDQADLFRTHAEILREALKRQESKIAYVAQPNTDDVAPWR